MHSYVGEGVIDVPLQQVAELVKDVESSYIWEKFLVVCTLAKVLTAAHNLMWLHCRKPTVSR